MSASLLSQTNPAVIRHAFSLCDCTFAEIVVYLRFIEASSPFCESSFYELALHETMVLICAKKARRKLEPRRCEVEKEGSTQ